MIITDANGAYEFITSWRNEPTGRQRRYLGYAIEGLKMAQSVDTTRGRLPDLDLADAIAVLTNRVKELDADHHDVSLAPLTR